MASADDMRRKYFTQKGEDALLTRLKTLIRIFEDEKTVYPFNRRMLGFVPLTILSKEALYYMIGELRQILNLPSISLKSKDEYGRGEVLEI